MTSQRTQIARAGLNDETQTMEIGWGDGHSSAFPLRYLRDQCPCAACRSEREEAKKNPFRVLKPGAGPPSVQLSNVEEVGRYGMRLTWGDGHATGIYTFEYLRSLCPCPECQAERQPDDRPYVHGIYIPK